MKRFFILTLLVSFYRIGYNQTERLQSEYFLYWQNETKICFSDYKKQADSIDLEMLKKYSVKSLANIQIHAVLDYPIKARKIRILKEQWYIAPVFCKECSPIIEQDSTEIIIAQIYFDIAEYCARLTRKKIAELNDLNMGNGFIAAGFPNRIEEMYNLMGDMFGSFGKQVIIDKKEGAIEEWRTSVNEMLEITEEYSTSTTECIRFINEKPYSDEYKVSYAIYGKEL